MNAISTLINQNNIAVVVEQFGAAASVALPCYLALSLIERAGAQLAQQHNFSAAPSIVDLLTPTTCPTNAAENSAKQDEPSDSRSDTSFFTWQKVGTVIKEAIWGSDYYQAAQGIAFKAESNAPKKLKLTTAKDRESEKKIMDLLGLL